MRSVLVTILTSTISIHNLQASPPKTNEIPPTVATSADDLYSRAKTLAAGPDRQATLDVLKEALTVGSDPVRALTDPAFLPLHESPEFRNLIRRFSKSSKTTLVTPDEPGSPMRVQGRIIDGEGKPVAGARIYVFQTGLSGSYSTAGGNAADSGDSLNPRIFGFMISAEDGSYAFSTIRPGQYPNDGPPAHIHYEVRMAGFEPAVTEVLFEDDSRMTAETKEWVGRAGFGLCKPTRDPTGVQQCTFDIALARTRT